MSMNLVLQQIAIIFGYVAVGAAAGKLGVINPEQRKFLTLSHIKVGSICTE